MCAADDETANASGTDLPDAERDLRPQKRERLADLLYQRLIQQIEIGLYSEGDKLPTEKELCHLFDVSRPVVREALMRLQSDGLVVARQGAGTFVKKRPVRKMDRVTFDMSGFMRSLEVRIGIEGQSARLAAMRRSAEQMDAIERIQAESRAAVAEGRFGRDHDHAFHLAIAQATGNVLFGTILQRTEPLGTMFDFLADLAGRELAHIVVSEHEMICRAIARADADAAETMMRFHLLQARIRGSASASED